MRLFPVLLLVSVAFTADAIPTNILSSGVKLRRTLASPSFPRYTSTKDLIEHDRARIESFAAHSGAPTRSLIERTFSSTLLNEDDAFLIPVTLCGTVFDLAVDLASGNTWFAAGKVASSCGMSTGHTFSLEYATGPISGNERTAPVTIGGVTFTLTFGVATSSAGFDLDGVLGLGPVDLTQGTVTGVSTVPTVLDALKTQGIIAVEAAGLYFPPTGAGECTFGGADTTKYKMPLTYYAVTKTTPYSYYWGITTTSLLYGTTTLSSTNSAIIDSGTTLIYIPTAAYTKFLSLAGGTTDSTTGLARFTVAPTGTFDVTIGTLNYPLTPAQYLVPTADYSLYGLNAKYFYAWINDGGSVAADVNFIIGLKFLNYYYSVYDVTNSRIGLAASV